MSDNVQLLQHEFEAHEGSFLLELRVNAAWDKVAFTRLLTAMHEYVRTHEEQEQLPRWIAEGFWYLSTAIPNWTDNPGLKQHEQEYYEKAFAKLNELAYWLFVGESPFEDDSQFEPL